MTMRPSQCTRCSSVHHHSGKIAPCVRQAIVFNNVGLTSSDLILMLATATRHGGIPATLCEIVLPNNAIDRVGAKALELAIDGGKLPHLTLLDLTNNPKIDSATVTSQSHFTRSVPTDARRVPRTLRTTQAAVLSACGTGHDAAEGAQGAHGGGAPRHARRDAHRHPRHGVPAAPRRGLRHRGGHARRVGRGRALVGRQGHAGRGAGAAGRG